MPMSEDDLEIQSSAFLIGYIHGCISYLPIELNKRSIYSDLLRAIEILEKRVTENRLIDKEKT